MKLAIIEKILEIEPIPDADNIELAKIQGWKSVIKKNEYKVGDTIVFVPIDTVMQPKEWNKFFWNKKDPSKPINVKIMKLRGVFSAGLIFPVTILGDHSFNLGDDVSSLLEISKYEKPIPIHLTGQVAGNFPTHLVSKTDEDNLLSNIEVLKEFQNVDMVEASLKIDGTSSSYIKESDGKFRVCSRNQELKDTETNVYWRMARKYNIENVLRAGYCIQAEIAGPGIQGNKCGFNELCLKVFNVFDLSTREPLHRNSWWKAFNFEHNIPYVPIIRNFTREEFNALSTDDLQNWVNNFQYENKTPAEGVVFRGFKDYKSVYSKKLQKMLSVKIINQNF